ncbi:MAG: bifunctional lysine ketoglutarate reductase /saccharopine dehydrogenase family protein [Candidatus Thermoplasmatota archaeon]
MPSIIGIRKEDKNKWERRAPLIPEHIKELIHKHSIKVIVQSSKIRIFSNEEYTKAGCMVQEELSSCPIIFAIKEIPSELIQPEKTYVFFSHTTKGQKHNMPMLKKLLEQKCNLIDYEKIVNETGMRLIFFGKHAGYAGMIDTLWALGQRLNWEGIKNPFSNIQQTIFYESLSQAKEALVKVGERIRTGGIDRALVPLVCGFAGYGNVSKGAQEILDILPTKEISPEELSNIYNKPSGSHIYKVVFKEEHMVEPISAEKPFQLKDYYENPERYKSKFHNYIPHLTILMNCIYWDSRYPRFVTKEYLKKLYSAPEKPRLRVIGDISCDINGAVECTLRATDPEKPIFVYNPFEDSAKLGYEGNGVVVLAVDNLPCELPIESSKDFSEVLKNFIPDIVNADFSGDFDNCNLPKPIKNAVIVYHGELTPNYRYMEKFL